MSRSLCLLAVVAVLCMSQASALPAASCTSWKYTLTHTKSVVAPPVLPNPVYLFPTDDGVTDVAFNFSFPFYAVNYDSANVSTNGNVQFDSGNIAWVDESIPQPDMGQHPPPPPPMHRSVVCEVS